MNLTKLLDEYVKKGKLKKQATGLDYLDGLLEAAKRNFEAAAIVKNKVDEASFKLVYDGLLQISRIILLCNGYRPSDGEQHKTTFAVAGELLGPDYCDLIERIQRFRVKRNDCIYEPKILISRAESEAIFNIAKEFWGKVKVYLERKVPQLKLFKNI